MPGCVDPLNKKQGRRIEYLTRKACKGYSGFACDGDLGDLGDLIHVSDLDELEFLDLAPRVQDRRQPRLLPYRMKYQRG